MYFAQVVACQQARTSYLVFGIIFVILGGTGVIACCLIYSKTKKLIKEPQFRQDIKNPAIQNIFLTLFIRRPIIFANLIIRLPIYVFAALIIFSATLLSGLVLVLSFIFNIC